MSVAYECEQIIAKCPRFAYPLEPGRVHAPLSEV